MTLPDTVEVSRAGLAGIYRDLMTMINEGKAREQVLQARVAELERRLAKQVSRGL